MESDQNEQKYIRGLQCEAHGDANLDAFRRLHFNTEARILVQKLPVGITKEGVENLFLTIGTPLSIKFTPHKNHAVVTFDSLNKAELAIRDLNNKPPYKLKVFLLKSNDPDNVKILNSSDKNIFKEGVEGKRFLKEEISLRTPKLHEIENSEILSDLQSLFKIVDYNPSYRIHQKKCDFKIQFKNSVSLGRGYFYLGEDRFIGGLQNFSASDNTEDYYCENCNSFTYKTCNNCEKSFCSKTCLQESLNHKKSGCFNGFENSVGGAINFLNGRAQERYEDPTLISPSDIVISSFSTLQIVYVRRIDPLWNDKFTRMCNDVALAAVKGKTFEECPQVDDWCIAKFYEDCCYYRAKIVSIKDEGVNVFFLDFGNVQETNLKDLKHLPENLKYVPGLAVKVNLKHIPEGTSADAITYYNLLTAEGIPLILKYHDSLSNGVILIEKESGENVNEKVKNLILPSWKKDPSALSKLGEVFYWESLLSQSLEIGKSYDLTISFVDENEFQEFGCFWITIPGEDHFLYVKGEMSARITEYCEYLRDDCYLPRDNELCLGKSNDPNSDARFCFGTFLGEWQRCVNLKSIETTCWLFFVDEGKTSFVETKNIRKMIYDFLESPSQAIRCVISGTPKLKDSSELELNVYNYLKSKVGTKVNSVLVSNFSNSHYLLSIPEIS